MRGIGTNLSELRGIQGFVGQFPVKASSELGKIMAELSKPIPGYFNIPKMSNAIYGEAESGNLSNNDRKNYRNLIEAVSVVESWLNPSTYEDIHGFYEKLKESSKPGEVFRFSGPMRERT